MPLYELLCVSAISPSTAPFRELVRSTTRLVVDHGGAVRAMRYWGRRQLPQRTRRHQQWHYEGDYFLMHFDTSPPVLSQLSSRLRADPRVVKWTTLKLGEKLEDITPPGTSVGYTAGSANSAKADYGETKPTPPAQTVMGGGRTVE